MDAMTHPLRFASWCRPWAWYTRAIAQVCMAFFLTFLCPLVFAQKAGPFCVQDDLDRPVCVAPSKQGTLRVVSLAPHLTEIVYFLKAGPQVVAVDRSSDYPQEAQRLPKVGDSLRLDMERVIALKPDLVLAWASGTSQTQINQLQKLGVPVFVSEPLGIEAVVSTMRRVSILVGMEAESRKAIDEWQQAFSKLGLKSSSGSDIELKKSDSSNRANKVRVFYQVWHDPLMTLSGKHVVSEIIQRCGGVTGFAQSKLLAPTVSIESVLQFNPQLILATAQPSSLSHWSRWTSLEAVRNKQLKVITPDILVRSGPRLLQAAQEVCGLIQVAGKFANESAIRPASPSP